MENNEAKSCPWCGDSGIVQPALVDRHVWAVVCMRCNATGPIEHYDNARQSKRKAVELWNARSDA